VITSRDCDRTGPTDQSLAGRTRFWRRTPESSPSQMFSRRQSSCEAEREHSRGARRLDAVAAVLYHGAGGWIHAHPCSGVKEEVRGGFSPGNLADAEDASRKAVVQAGQAQRVAYLLVGPTGCDARGKHDQVKGFDDAIDRPELGGEGVSIEMLERVLPISREPTAEEGSG
jgi:hypothetical protein